LFSQEIGFEKVVANNFHNIISESELLAEIVK
jgi:hypothetical protein